MSWAQAKAITAVNQYVYAAFQQGEFTDFVQVDVQTGKSTQFYKVPRAQCTCVPERAV